MSIDPALLRALQAAGGTIDQVIALVEADAASEEAKREARRAGNAERQRRFKAKRKVTKANGSNALPSVIPSPNDIYSNPQPVPLDIPDGISPPIDDRPVSLEPEHVVEAWNETAERLGLPKARLTPQRRRLLKTRIREHPIEDFTEAIAAIERSPFLRGDNPRAWRADFDFLLQPKSFTKLIEGSYDH